MPQDYTATNPQTGETVRWDGKSWTPVEKPSSSGLSSFGQGVVDVPKSLPQFAEAGNKDSILGSFPEKQVGESQDYMARANQALASGDHLAYIGHVINAVLAPTMIPQAVEGLTHTSESDPLRAAGQIAGMGLMEKLPEMAGRTGQGAVESTRGPVRSILGVGKDFEKRIADEHETALVDYNAKLKNIREQNVRALNEGRQSHEATVSNIEKQNAEALAKHREKVQGIKDQYAAQVGEKQAATPAASASGSAADAKRSAFGDSPRSGPIFQRLKGMTSQVYGMIDNLQDRIRSHNQQQWRSFDGAVEEAMKKKGADGAQVNWTPVQQAVKDAEANILKGSPESIAIFRNIMKESPQLDQAAVFKTTQAMETTQNMKDILRTANPNMRRQILANLHAQGISEADLERSTPQGEEPTGLPGNGVKIPFADARGYFTELGGKIAGAQLPGDVYRALDHVRNAADKAITDVTKEAGQDSVYRNLKSEYKTYKQNFDDPDSAIYQFDKLDTPEKRVDFLASGKGQNLIESLGKYREFGSDPTMVGRVRSLVRQIRDLPGEKAIPSSPERPKFPGQPESKPLPTDQPISLQKPPIEPEPLDMTRKRLEALEEKAKQFSSFNPSQVRWLSSGIRQRMLGHWLSNPAFREWVAKGGGTP